MSVRKFSSSSSSAPVSRPWEGFLFDNGRLCADIFFPSFTEDSILCRDHELPSFSMTFVRAATGRYFTTTFLMKLCHLSSFPYLAFPRHQGPFRLYFPLSFSVKFPNRFYSLQAASILPLSLLPQTPSVLRNVLLDPMGAAIPISFPIVKLLPLSRS